MKKNLIITALIMACVGLAFAQHYSVTVGTSSTVIVPKSNPAAEEITTWTNNHVVAQGDYIQNTGTPARIYFAISAGTSTNMPAHTYGADTTNDAVSWLYVKRATGNISRQNAVIYSDRTQTVYYTADGSDATTAGAILDALQPARAFPGNQGEIKGIGTVSSTVNVELINQ